VSDSVDPGAGALSLGRDRFRELATADEPVVVTVTAPLPDAEPLTAYTALTDADDGPAMHPDAPDGAAAHAFLLESAEKVASSDPDGAFRPSTADAGRHARYSFVGYAPDARVQVTGGTATEDDGPDPTVSIDPLREGAPVDTMERDGGDVLDALRAALPDVTVRGDTDGPRLTGGLVGFLAYDAVYDVVLDEVGLDRPDSPVPDAEFVLTTRTVAFDELADTVELVHTPVIQPGDDPDAVYDALVAETERVASILADAPPPDPGGFVQTDGDADPRADYEDAVRTAKEHVLDGDIYQGVISRRRIREGRIDPVGFYAALRDVNPSPYMYLLRGADRTVVGASPETLVSVRDDAVTVNPIAGTCERGTSPVEDRRLAGEMLADDKERAEHTMLVDLARNDARRVSAPGTVRVEEFMNVLKYSHVQHIESTVVGQLRDDADAFDALRAAFPAGTLTGAPKIRAMEIIDALEAAPRGVYGGGVGYVSWTGDADAAIVIRSATIEHGGGSPNSGMASADAAAADRPTDTDRIVVQAGAGIVADSDPASEYDETERKMDGVLVALDRITERAEKAAARTTDGALDTAPDGGGDE
jgi:anthranilate synthase component 1